MTLHRFCCPDATWDGDRVQVNGAVAAQIRRVLRLGPGDQVILFGTDEWEYTVRLDGVEQSTAYGTVVARAMPATEPRCELTLAFALLKGEKTDWVIQKGTELGVSRFVLMQTERTVATPDERRAAGRRERYERIAREATEQCGRVQPPCIEGVVPFAHCLSDVRDLVVILHESATERLSSLLAGREAPFAVPSTQTPSARLSPASGSHHDGSDRPSDQCVAPIAPSALLLVGPEGGFTDDEVALARHHGAVAATLGPRVLRAETAALAAVTLVVGALD